MIETAKSNKLNPYDYIEFILDYLPQQDLVEDPERLDWFLPWSEEIKEDFEIKCKIFTWNILTKIIINVNYIHEHDENGF